MMALLEIELDMAAIAAVHEAAVQAAAEAMEAVKTDLVSSRTVPFYTGTMQGSLHVEQFRDGGEVHTVLQTDGPQARRLYFHPEYTYFKGKNPHAGAAWYAPYTAGGEKEAFLPDVYAARLKEKLP